MRGAKGILRHRKLWASAVALLALVVATTSSYADDTTGRSTLQQTLEGGDPDGERFRFLRLDDGERYTVREDLAKAKSGRKNRRKSVIYSGQITDFQLSDEESPARVEFLDPEPSGFASSAWRPQEALVAHETDLTIRQLNHFVRSPVRDSDGDRARMANAVMTGDLADNAQRNETQGVVQLLEGGVYKNGERKTRKFDPNSGTNDYSGSTCRGMPRGSLGDPRKYAGVQDYDDYPGRQGNGDFYDPDRPVGRYEEWPRYGGLQDEAQKRFRVRGLKVPSYVAFGNHDSLVQGNEDAIKPFEDVATGCVKFFPSPGGVPKTTITGPRSALEEDGLPQFKSFLTNPIGVSPQLVPPDENRQFVDKKQFRRLHDTGKQKDEHGFAYIDKAERRASNGAASYYDFSPKRGVRYIVLDTVSEGGRTPESSSGNLDDPQFRWLKGELRQATRRDELIVVFGHHATGSLEADVADEMAAPCTVRDEHGHDQNPGCDRDPRSSTPIHLGDDVEALFHSFPHVIGYVTGHSHENMVSPLASPSGGDFWEIKSPAVVDWPTQHRLVEVMDNRDGTLSIFGTLLDHDGPATAPKSGSTNKVGGFDSGQLGSVGRTLSYNDPQQGPDGSEGEPNDRNVELLIRDPRRGDRHGDRDGDCPRHSFRRRDSCR